MYISDVIVIGAGPAGLSCAIELSKYNISCIVLEAKSDLKGIVCGEGLSVRSLKLLEVLGINAEKINGKKIYYIKKYKENKIKKYSIEDIFDTKYEIGVPRDCFDNLLLHNAIKYGACVLFNTPFKTISEQHELFLINDEFWGRSIVFACGVNGGRTLGLLYPKYLPVGISGRIIGDCPLEADTFHYFFSNKYENGYAWVFPVGEKVWNVGVWSQSKNINLKKLYTEFENSFFNAKEICYSRKPSGRVIGAGDFKQPIRRNLYYIGDCALLANPISGEGIASSLSSGIRTAELIKKGLDNNC